MHSLVYTYSPIFTFGEFLNNLYKWAHALIMTTFANLCAQFQIPQHMCRLCHTFTSNLATTTIPPQRLCHPTGNQHVLCQIIEENKCSWEWLCGGCMMRGRTSTWTAGNLVLKPTYLRCSHYQLHSFFNPKVSELTDHLARWAERNSEGMLVGGSSAEERQSWWQQKSTEPRQVAFSTPQVTSWV